VGALFLIRKLRNGRARRRRAAEGWKTLALAFVPSWVILTLISNKDPRYIMPLIPIVGVISTHWIAALGPRAQRAAVAGVACLAYAMTCWNLFVLAPPDPSDMKVETLADWIVAQTHPEDQRITVLVIPNDPRLNSTAVDFALRRRDGHYRARPVREPLTAARMREYQYILIVAPPDEDTGIAPFVKQNTCFAGEQQDWATAISFTRDDGKEIRVLSRSQ
jgi:hypothetical protein